MTELERKLDTFSQVMTTIMVGIIIVMSVLLIYTGCWFWWLLFMRWAWASGPQWFVDPTLHGFLFSCGSGIIFVILLFKGGGR